MLFSRTGIGNKVLQYQSFHGVGAQVGPLFLSGILTNTFGLGAEKQMVTTEFWLHILGKNFFILFVKIRQYAEKVRLLMPSSK